MRHELILSPFKLFDGDLCWVRPQTIPPGAAVVILGRLFLLLNYLAPHNCRSLRERLCRNVGNRIALAGVFVNCFVIMHRVCWPRLCRTFPKCRHCRRHRIATANNVRARRVCAHKMNVRKRAAADFRVGSQKPGWSDTFCHSDNLPISIAIILKIYTYILAN